MQEKKKDLLMIQNVLSVKHSGGSALARSCMAACGMTLLISIGDGTHDGNNKISSEVFSDRRHAKAPVYKSWD